MELRRGNALRAREAFANEESHVTFLSTEEYRREILDVASTLAALVALTKIKGERTNPLTSK